MLAVKIHDKLTDRCIVLPFEDYLKFLDFLKRNSLYVKENPVEDKVVYYSLSLDVAEVEWAMALCTFGYLSIEDRGVKKVTITKKSEYSQYGAYTWQFVVTVDIEPRDY